jgi:hypothetical protein
MTPKLASIISKTIGYFIILISGVFYIQRIVIEPLDKVIAISLSAIGIIGVLSATCYQAVPCFYIEPNREVLLYAAEKFLHSVLLIIQTLFLKFALTQILIIEFVKNITWLTKVINASFQFLLLGTGAFALYFACFGFDSLNTFLWERYEQRMNQRVENKNKKKR